MTVAFSLITFYLKLKDRRANAPAKLAISETSWDADSRFPIYPLPNPLKVAPFPFIASDLTTRTKSKNGWFTVTELRIWNAGKGIIFGPLVKRTTVAQVCIPRTVGEYKVWRTFSNDPELRFNLGRPTRNVSATEDRIPIWFDFMHAGKGILISICHNSAVGEGIRIKAFSEQTPVSAYGTHHVFRVSVVKFMNKLTDFLLIPFAVFATVMFYTGNTWLFLVSAICTWMLIVAAYLRRTFTVTPDDLI